jgi:hypothetical protein
MAKRQHTTSVDLYGMPGHGRNVAEAKAHAATRLCAAMDGTYAVRLFRFPTGIVGVVSRDPFSGWCYTVLKADQTHQLGATCSGMASADVAERRLRYAVAQILVFVADDNGVSIIENDADRGDHAQYVAWQERYRAYRGLGYSDADAHRMASDNG